MFHKSYWGRGGRDGDAVVLATHYSRAIHGRVRLVDLVFGLAKPWPQVKLAQFNSESRARMPSSIGLRAL